MSKFYIPDIGEEIKLDKDWTFALYDESRNSGLVKLVWPEHEEMAKAEFEKNKIEYEKKHNHSYGDFEYGNYYYNFSGQRCKNVTLNAGTILKVDRIYIRKGKSDYSSITFVLTKTTQFKTKNKPRFWVKLDDVNKIEFSSAFLNANRLLK